MDTGIKSLGNKGLQLERYVKLIEEIRNQSLESLEWSMGNSIEWIRILSEEQLLLRAKGDNSPSIAWHMNCLARSREVYSNAVEGDRHVDFSSSQRDKGFFVSKEELLEYSERTAKRLIEALKNCTPFDKVYLGIIRYNPFTLSSIIAKHESMHQGQLLVISKIHHTPIPEEFKIGYAIKHEY